MTTTVDASFSSASIDFDPPIFPAEESDAAPSFPGDDVAAYSQSPKNSYVTTPVFPSSYSVAGAACAPPPWLQKQRSLGEFKRYNQSPSTVAPSSSPPHPDASPSSAIPLHLPNSRSFLIPSLCTPLTVESCPEPQVHQICGKHPRTVYYMHHTQQMSCGVEHIEPCSEVPWHLHLQSSEMLYCTEGAGTVCITEGDIEREFAFHAGVMVCVPPLIPHRIVNDSSVQLKLVWCLSPPQSFEQMKAESNRVKKEASSDFETLDSNDKDLNAGTAQNIKRSSNCYKECNFFDSDDVDFSCSNDNMKIREETFPGTATDDNRQSDQVTLNQEEEKGVNDSTKFKRKCEADETSLYLDGSLIDQETNKNKIVEKVEEEINLNFKN